MRPCARASVRAACVCVCVCVAIVCAPAQIDDVWPHALALLRLYCAVLNHCMLTRARRMLSGNVSDECVATEEVETLAVDGYRICRGEICERRGCAKTTQSRTERLLALEGEQPPALARLGGLLRLHPLDLHAVLFGQQSLGQLARHLRRSEWQPEQGAERGRAHAKVWFLLLDGHLRVGGRGSAGSGRCDARNACRD